MKFKLLPTIIISTTFITLMSFGFWQLQRLTLKQTLIEHINQQIEQEAVVLPQEFKPSAASAYTKYKISGKFIKDKNIFLYGNNFALPSKAGYFILTPFLSEAGEYFLVNRGWSESKNIAPADNDDEITVLLMLPQKAHFSTPKNDLMKNIWLSVDLPEAAAFTGLNINQSFYLTVIEGNSDLLLPSAKDFTKIRNNHLEYAITWFSLALALLIVVYSKCRRSF
jgi:surfeit locus 1 family protein